MMNEMTSRQRVLTALSHRETDKVPFSWGFGINPPAKRDLMRCLNMDSMEELDAYLLKMDDIRKVEPDYAGPADRNCLKNGVRTDIWGIQWKYQSYGAGGYEEQAVNPLASAEGIDDLMRHRFPSADWWDFSGLPAKIAAANHDGEYAICIGNGNLFEQVSWMRGFENILADLLLEPEMVHWLMRRVTDYFLDFFQRALEAAGGRIDIVFTADDLGGQNGLLMSQDAIREFIAPYHRELDDLVHAHGAKVMYHSCGSVIKAVPILIDAGVDILESLQFYTAGMTPEALKDNFGDRMCFHGGVSVQRTLVSGTPEDVMAETARNMRVLGRQGGYILAPAHCIQAGTPPENILAMLKAAGRI